jgi:hypothetical protein
VNCETGRREDAAFTFAIQNKKAIMDNNTGKDGEKINLR